LQEVARRFKETVEWRVSEEGRAALEAEIKALQAAIAAAKAANQAVADTHDYREAETRDLFIDLLFREAGFDPKAPDTTEVEVTGMPNVPGVGYVDYVLTMASRWRWSKLSVHGRTHAPASNKRSSMPTASRRNTGSGQPSSTATATITGFGTIHGTRLGRSRASSRRTSWR